MKVTYKSKKLEKRCTIARETIKVYGVNKAELIHQRIDQIKSADTCGYSWTSSTISHWTLSSFAWRKQQTKDKKKPIRNGLGSSISIGFWKNWGRDSNCRNPINWRLSLTCLEKEEQTWLEVTLILPHHLDQLSKNN